MAEGSQPRSRYLITGAAGGMGSACARLAADRGASLVLADLSAQRLQELAAQCSALGAADVQCATLDVTDTAAVEALLAELGERPCLDGVVHTVGLSPAMADWERIIDVDLVSTVRLLEQLRPRLAPGAAVVAIASMSAYMVPPDDTVDPLLASPLAEDFAARLQQVAETQPLLRNSGMAYAWSKRALKNWVAATAPSWGAEGKRLVSISPGLIDTDMGRLENDAMGEEQLAGMRRHLALERFGSADDIARAALFLASLEAAYITGCDLLVDGGIVGAMLAARGA